MVRRKIKYKYSEPIGIINLLASIISLVALFSIIFLDPSLIIVLTNGVYLILFAINAYFARARILGYIFPSWVNWLMALTAFGTISVSIWAISTLVS